MSLDPKRHRVVGRMATAVALSLPTVAVLLLGCSVTPSVNVV